MAARLVGRGEAELVLVGDLLSRITVQTCRQSGLSVVYMELLDFGGDEIYFQEEPGLVGRTFGEALLAYQDSAVIGLRLKAGGVRVNPPMDQVIAAGDRAIAISEDDDTVRLSGPGIRAVDPEAIRAAPTPAPRPERTLILGWNWRLPTIVRELDQYVAPGSMVFAVASHEGGAAAVDRGCPGLQRLTVSYRVGDPTDRATLESIEVPGYDHVILLCDDGVPDQVADSRTLVTLLHLREIGDRAGHAFSIVSEMRDVRNRELAEVTRADDFIVGDRLVSLLLTQVSKHKELHAVFADLFDPEGSEIYLKPAATYVALGRAVSFYTVVESARRKGRPPSATARGPRRATRPAPTGWW